MTSGRDGQSNAWRAEAREVAVGALVFLVSMSFMWALLPHCVTPVDDDFGYFRSVVETAARGRPYTDDWLEPWAAGLSLLSAAILSMTGSFKLATYGVLSIAFGSFASLTLRNLLLWKFPLFHAAAIALLLSTFPVLVARMSEYTSVALTLPLLLGCVLAVERRRWIVFTLLWCFAISSRQSAIAWGPLSFALILPISSTTRGSVAMFAAVVCTGVSMFGLTGWAMNSTHAQTVMTTHMWQSLTLPAYLERFMAGASLCFVAIGWGALVRIPFSRQGLNRAARAASATPILAVAIWGLSTVAEPTSPFRMEGLGLVYAGAGLLAAGCGLVLCQWQVSAPLIWAAVGALSLASLRGVQYDYYWADAMLLAFLAAASRGESVRLGNGPSANGTKPRRALIYGAAILLFFMNSVYLCRLKETVDTKSALTELYERGLRARTVKPTELQHAPFGFQGWYLYPYYVSHEGKEGGYIAGFLDYVRPNSHDYETRAAHDRREIVDPDTVDSIATGKVGWRHSHQFILRRRSDAGEARVKVDEGDFKGRFYPLNDEEWETLISRRRHELRRDLADRP